MSLIEKNLDFTNLKLQQWLEACPYKIRNLEQLVFSTKPVDQKEVRLVVDIPIAECAVNFQYYGLTLREKTKELETRYEELDKEWKKLIVAEAKEKNPIKLIQLEAKTKAIYQERRKIIKDLKALLEAEKTSV
tara:strand:+ start:204 stop:602 length:399 start_codon:yes stop_codon:yes gene_type:complete